EEIAAPQLGIVPEARYQADGLCGRIIATRGRPIRIEPQGVVFDEFCGVRLRAVSLYLDLCAGGIARDLLPETRWDDDNAAYAAGDQQRLQFPAVTRIGHGEE